MNEITNEELVAEKLPPPSTSWREIGWFALTFNGDEHGGSFEAYGDVAEKKSPEFSDWERPSGKPNWATDWPFLRAATLAALWLRAR